MGLANARRLAAAMPVLAAFALLSASAQTIELSAGSSRCTVDLDGARIVSYRCAGEEVLWNATPPQKSAPDWAHGGLPVCWPRFGVDASGAIHGVAWRRTFSLLERRDGADRSVAVLGLSDGDARLEVVIALSDALSVEMRTTNAGTNEVLCSFGFHPYFRVSERSTTWVDGLDGLRFEDDPSRPRPERGVWSGDVRIEESIDRIFQLPEGRRTAFRLHDALRRRNVVVECEGASHLNVWNPGAEKNCPGVVPGDEWRRFVCVEPVFMAATDGSPVPIPPGGRRTLKMAIRVERSAPGVRWDFPREGCCHEGMAFADGKTGILVWGGGDTLKITVGRGDLWDHRGGYAWTPEQSYTNIIAAVRTGDNERLKALFRNEAPENWRGRYNPYMLPLGRVVVKVPGKTLMRGSLDPFTGLGEIEFSDGGRVSLAMSKENGGVFAMKFEGGTDFDVRTVPSTDFPVYEDRLKPIGFERAKVFDGAVAGVGGFRWKLPADEPVWLSWTKNGGTVSLKTGRGDGEVFAEACPFEAVATGSRDYWRRFWAEGARVKVPDPEIQEAFDYGMYKFGAMTDPDGFAAGLQGQWLEDDKLVPWNGDYHFNINVQECYSPAYRGGHFKNLMPLFRMVLSWRPLLRENARKFVGVDDGYVLPHSVDDRGVCIGGFWAGTIDHASTAWVASLMMRYVRYSRDYAFLREGGYDFMKGAMSVYRAMMEERDGRLSIPLGPSPEWGASDVRKAVGRDPSFQLAAAHRLARDLVDAAALLGEAADPMWLDVARRLPAYTKGPGGFQLFEGQPFVSSHRHHSHMAALYPFDIIDFADKAARGDALETYRNWVYKGTGEWTGWCVPWASILHTHFGNADAAAHMIRSWKVFYNNPGHGSLHDAFREGFTVFCARKTIMQMDGQCAATTAVMEMMAHEVGGEVEFFRGCPDSWREVSFENLALSDGRRVSGFRANGHITVKYVK